MNPKPWTEWAIVFPDGTVGTKRYRLRRQAVFFACICADDRDYRRTLKELWAVRRAEGYRAIKIRCTPVEEKP